MGAACVGLVWLWRKGEGLRGGEAGGSLCVVVGKSGSVGSESLAGRRT